MALKAYKFKEKMFFVGEKPKELRCMLSLTPNAHEALKSLADRSGETVQKIICDMLEDYLSGLAEQKVIPTPKS